MCGALQALSNQWTILIYTNTCNDLIHYNFCVDFNYSYYIFLNHENPEMKTPRWNINIGVTCRTFHVKSCILCCIANSDNYTDIRISGKIKYCVRKYIYFYCLEVDKQSNKFCLTSWAEQSHTRVFLQFSNNNHLGLKYPSLMLILSTTKFGSKKILGITKY